MIVKNKLPIDQVYKREKKVGGPGLSSLQTVGRGAYGDVTVCIHRITG